MMPTDRRILSVLALLMGGAGAACEGTLVKPNSGTSGQAPGTNGAAGPQGTGTAPSLNPATGMPIVVAPTASDCNTGTYPGPAPLRRLTRREYNGTVAELLNDTSAPAKDFVPEETALGFNNNAEALTTSTLLAEQYMGAAEKLARAATSDLTALLPCDAAADADGCAKQFITAFGTSAFRRPIAGEEQARFEKTYLWGKQNQDFRAGIEMVIEAMLQSASFLYRVEFGEGAPTAGTLALSDWEVATRLSYLLVGSMPDKELFAAATKGALSTQAEVDLHAARLVKEARARGIVKDFQAQWLGLGPVATLERDAKVYAGYTSSVPGLFLSETETFLDHVFWDGEGTVQELLTAPYTFLNGDLAKFYGVADPGSTTFAKVTTGSVERAGILSQGSVLASHAQPLQTSPVHRGKFVREQILCQLLPPPPANLVITPPELDPNLSTRERFSQHSSDIACAGCHQLMDPIGLGFEHWDPVGRYRDMENGKPVSGAGELFSTDVDGPFDGTMELGSKLAGSAAVNECVAKQWFRYAFGRSETAEDACSMSAIKSAMKADNNRMQSLLLAFAQTDAFRYRKVVTP